MNAMDKPANYEFNYQHVRVVCNSVIKNYRLSSFTVFLNGAQWMITFLLLCLRKYVPVFW